VQLLPHEQLLLSALCCFAVVRCCTQVCSETYGLAPEVVVSGDMSARVPYLTSHLDYMVYELLKNCMRAGEACMSTCWLLSNQAAPFTSLPDVPDVYRSERRLAGWPEHAAQHVAQLLSSAPLVVPHERLTGDETWSRQECMRARVSVHPVVQVLTDAPDVSAVCLSVLQLSSGIGRPSTPRAAGPCRPSW
jgi:hypothetical protein